MVVAKCLFERGQMMQKYIGRLIIFVSFICIAGCTNSDNDYTPADTDIVKRNSGEIKNEARLIDFIHHVENGQDDHIRVVAYTKEGDPILMDVTFSENQLEVTSDTTRDEHGKGEVNTFTCETVQADDQKYYLIGCEGFHAPYYLVGK